MRTLGILQGFRKEQETNISACDFWLEQTIYFPLIQHPWDQTCARLSVSTYTDKSS